MLKEPKYLKDIKPNEHIITVVRHHWFWLFERVIGLLILFFIPFFFIPILTPFLNAGGGAVEVPQGVMFFFGSLWTLILWQMFFAKWTDFYYDIWIITNWRIVDVDQRGLWNRDVATVFDLDNIEDISTKTDTVLANILGFGDVQVQTAAANREFIMRSVARPRAVENMIQDAQEKRIGLETRH